MAELKPCPFCGSKTKVIRTLYVGPKRRRTRLVYGIGCTDPMCILYATDKTARLYFIASKQGKETMIKRWKRRAGEKE